MHTKIIRLGTLVLIFVSILSCGSVPVKNDLQLEPNYESSYLTVGELPLFIDSAKTKIEPARSRELLEAAQSLLIHNEYEWAISVLEEVNPKFLSYDEQAQRILAYAKSNSGRGDQYNAQNYLLSKELDNLTTRVETTTLLDILDQRATLFHNSGEYKKSISERIKRTELIDDEFEQQLNQDLIWLSLMELPRSALQEASTQESNQTAQGWYALAALSKNNQSNATQQLKDIENWSIIWEGHPAASLLPADLLVIKQIAAEQVEQIGVLLPLTGRLKKAGNAIRDGLMAAHFNAVKQGEHVPQVKYYDTNQANITELYQQAIYDGAQAIVGPLDKTHIDTLINSELSSVTTLALNRSQIPVSVSVSSQDDEGIQSSHVPLTGFEHESIDLTHSPDSGQEQLDQHSSSASFDINNESKIDNSDLISETENPNLISTTGSNKNIFQFALSAQDEAIQMAERAWRDGHRRVLMMYPRRSSGERNANEFKQAWLNMGGEILSEVIFDRQQQYSELVENAMQLNDSKSRHRVIKQLIGQQVEFEPRARQDIDFIYLVARTQEARQLKPILAFHYAGDVPVYATSDVFSGEQQARSNKDLNGIRFTTMPWFFETELTEKRSISSYIGETGQFQRLYAFGIDAYRLFPRLKKLRQIRQSNFYGVTGKLFLDEQQRIIREQVWAQFKSGVASPMTNTAEETLNEF